MSSHDIITKLSSPQTKNHLQKLSIKHLWLFGSHAKNLATPTSDVDILYEINTEIDQSGFAFFTALSNIRDIVGGEVDFVSVHHIHPDVASEVLSTKLAIW